MILGGLRPELVPWGERLLAEARQPYQVTSVYRSPLRQLRLYRRSQRELDYPFPVAPPGCDCATHTQRLSWDMISTPAELRRLGMLWRSWGGIWGNDQDPIHFQGSAAMMRNPPRRLQERRSPDAVAWPSRGDRSFIRPT